MVYVVFGEFVEGEVGFEELDFREVAVLFGVVGGSGSGVGFSRVLGVCLVFSVYLSRLFV